MQNVTDGLDVKCTALHWLYMTLAGRGNRKEQKKHVFYSHAVTQVRVKEEVGHCANFIDVLVCIRMQNTYVGFKLRNIQKNGCAFICLPGTILCP